MWERWVSVAVVGPYENEHTQAHKKKHLSLQFRQPWKELWTPLPAFNRSISGKVSCGAEGVSGTQITPDCLAPPLSAPQRENCRDLLSK